MEKVLAERILRAERVLLGCVLISPGVWPQAAVLTEQDFSLKAHRVIFSRMKEMAEAGLSIDEARLVDELSRHDELGRVMGGTYIASLTDGAVERKDIGDLLSVIQESSIRRAAAKTGEILLLLAADGTVNPSVLAELAAQFVGQNRESPDALPPQFSEEALALRFSRQYSGDLRYVSAWDRWLCWNGGQWHQDTTLEVLDRVRELSRRASAECGSTQDKVKVAVRLASSASVAAIERLARADRRHAATVEQWDRDPWLLNTPQGIVDLRTGKIQEHHPEHYLTKTTAAGPGGDCPIWLKFLARITDGNIELQSFLQRIVGYCLTGVTREHALFFFFGSGANGKSVFTSVIGGLLASYAKTAPALTFMATRTEQHPTDIAGLRGARLVIASETEIGSRWAESKIKSITGGDVIAARLMRCDFFEFVPQFKIVVAGNNKPRLCSVNEAMRRRLHLVPFTVTIPKGERDTVLVEKLQAEYPGVLRWAIEGCLAWQSQGLNPPEVVRSATSEYFAVEDLIDRWIDDRCVKHHGIWTSGAALFEDWEQWCGTCGERPGSRKAFSQSLEEHGIKNERSGSGTRGFAGIGIRDVSSTLPTDDPMIAPRACDRERPN
jgi:putative DNA primase/helicase